MEALQSVATAGESLGSPPLPPDTSAWPELVEEQVFFVKKVLPTWGMQEVEMANGIGDAEGMEMEMDMKQGEGMESAVACEAVEFEDLFANPIEQGSNLE